MRICACVRSDLLTRMRRRPAGFGLVADVLDDSWWACRRRNSLGEALHRLRGAVSSMSPARPMTRLLRRLALPQIAVAPRAGSRRATLGAERRAAMDATGITASRTSGSRVRCRRRGSLEDLRRLAQKARVLLFGEQRGGEDVGAEVDHGIEVARQREAGDRDRVAADRDSSVAPSESSVSSSAGGRACRRRGGRAARHGDAGPRCRADCPTSRRGS